MSKTKNAEDVWKMSEPDVVIALAIQQVQGQPGLHETLYPKRGRLWLLPRWEQGRQDYVEMGLTAV